MKFTFKKHLHLTLCALLSLGVSSGSAPTQTVENIITKKQDDKKEGLYYYSDMMERGNLPTLFNMGGLGELGIALSAAFIPELVYVYVAGGLGPQGWFGAQGLISKVAVDAAAAQGTNALAYAATHIAIPLIVAYITFKLVQYGYKQYSVTLPETLKTANIATRIAKGRAHFIDPRLQAFRQAYYSAASEKALLAAWTFFDAMYTVDAPYFVCGEKISFYPAPANDYYLSLSKSLWEQLGWPRTTSTQDMTQEEGIRERAEYSLFYHTKKQGYTGWDKFKDFALLILQDKTLKEEEYHKKVTAALKILEWVRNATPQDKPEAITTEAKEIVKKIVEDENIKTYLNTQEKMLKEVVDCLEKFDPLFKAYGSKDPEQNFEKELEKLPDLKDYGYRLTSQNVYQQKWAITKFVASLADIDMTGYAGAIMLRKIIAPKVNAIQKSYQTQLLTSYKEFYPNGNLESLNEKLSNRNIPLTNLNFNWLNDKTCADVVRYGLIEVIITDLIDRNNVKTQFSDALQSRDDLAFTDKLAELCMTMLREVLKNQNPENDDEKKSNEALKNLNATEADLNNAVSKALTLPAYYKDWSSYRLTKTEYEAWQTKYYNEVAMKSAKAVKAVRIINMFFDKLFTANERDRFMGSVGFSGEDTKKRLITLTLWHLKANYPNIISIKLEEYYKANSRWGDYISGKLSNLGIDMSKK